MSEPSTVNVGDGVLLQLASHPRGALVRAVVESFRPAVTPGARVLYVSAGGADAAFIDRAALTDLGIDLDADPPPPDVLLHLPDRAWLVAVDATGPLDEDRAAHLRRRLAGSGLTQVLVSAFDSRRSFSAHAACTARDTHVWCAAEPTHLIHFGGERLHGPA